MQSCLSSYEWTWNAALTTISRGALADAESALSSALGDAVITAAPELDAYTADTYWPALHAKAAGAPIARPDVVVRPRTEEDVATVVAIAHEHRVPVVAWGGGSGTQGGALAIRGGIVVDLRPLDEVIEVDEESMTVTVQAGKNGRELEAELNGPGLTQLFVGSEGTLGIITQVTLQVVPMPESRRFAAVAFPTVGAGIGAIRRALQVGHRPSVVRLYDEEATRLAFSPVVGEDLSGVYTVLAFEGEAEAAALEERRTLEIAREAGAELLDPALGQRWWDRRYDFYRPPHQPELPAIWGTLDVVATYSRIEAG